MGKLVMEFTDEFFHLGNVSVSLSLIIILRSNVRFNFEGKLSNIMVSFKATWCEMRNVRMDFFVYEQFKIVILISRRQVCN